MRTSQTGRITRRQLLQAAGAGGAALWLSPRLLVAAPLDLGQPGPGTDLLVHTNNPWNAEPALADLVQSWITPVKYFYVRSHAPFPKLDAETFTLSVEGLVDKPLKLKRAQLEQKFPQTKMVATMTCAGNRREEVSAIKPVSGVQWSAGAIGNAEWGGVDLAKVLKAAGVKPEAKYVWFEGVDDIEKSGKKIHFGGSISLDKAMGKGDKPGAMIATRMNGEELIPAHGFPMRTVVPGYIGSRSVKWLGKIVVSDRPSENHYLGHAYKLITKDTEEQWDEADPIFEYRLNSAICIPKKRTKVASGPLRVQGYALPEGDPGNVVTKVEVSADGGRTWTEAKFSHPPQPFCWRLWKADVKVAPDTKALLARATDSNGTTQPKEVPWNFKGYMYNAWYRTPIRVK
jgi:sulfite oxidase